MGYDVLVFIFVSFESVIALGLDLKLDTWAFSLVNFDMLLLIILGRGK